MRTLNIQYTVSLTLINSNYACLEHIYGSRSVRTTEGLLYKFYNSQSDFKFTILVNRSLAEFILLLLLDACEFLSHSIEKFVRSCQYHTD